MTMSTVLMTTLSTPPPKTGSEMMGKVSLTTMLAKRREMRRRCPFLRIGMIFSAYLRCLLCQERVSLRPRRTRGGTHGVPLMLRTWSCVSSKLMYPSVRPAKRPDSRTRTGMRHAKTMNLASCGSDSLFTNEWTCSAAVWREKPVSLPSPCVARVSNE